MVKKVLDQKPQFMNLSAVESAANTYTEIATSTPVVPAISAGKSIVMEILKIFIYTTPMPQVANQLSTLDVWVLKKKVGSVPLPSDSNIVTYGSRSIACGAAIGPVVYWNEPIELDLTDGQGNGYLFGNKEIIVAVDTNNVVAVFTAYVKILYRLVEVSSNELLGILQE